MNDGGFAIGVLFIIIIALATMYTRAETINQQLDRENRKLRLEDFYRNYNLYDLELVEEEMRPHYSELYRKYAEIIRRELPSDDFVRKYSLSVRNEDVENYIMSQSKDKDEVAFLFEYLEVGRLIENKRRIKRGE